MVADQQKRAVRRLGAVGIGDAHVGAHQRLDARAHAGFVKLHQPENIHQVGEPQRRTAVGGGAFDQVFDADNAVGNRKFAVGAQGDVAGCGHGRQPEKQRRDSNTAPPPPRLSGCLCPACRQPEKQRLRPDAGSLKAEPPPAGAKRGHCGFQAAAENGTAGTLHSKKQPESTIAAFRLLWGCGRLLLSGCR